MEYPMRIRSIWRKSMNFLPDVFKWVYEKWFVGHPMWGFIAVAFIVSVFVWLVIFIFWRMGVDKYDAEHRLADTVSVPASGAAIPKKESTSPPSHTQSATTLEKTKNTASMKEIPSKDTPRARAVFNVPESNNEIDIVFENFSASGFKKGVNIEKQTRAKVTMKNSIMDTKESGITSSADNTEIVLDKSEINSKEGKGIEIKPSKK